MTIASDKLLRRLEWHVLRRLDGRLQGAYRTAWHGVGIDFTDLREYLPEDDVRHIDWNVTARMDEVFVRQYTEERELTAWLVLDRSASMRGAGAGQGKDSVLVDLAVCLARLLTRNGNKVGAILFDNNLRHVIPPAGGRTQTQRIAHELDQTAVTKGSGASTDLTAMIKLAAVTARRRSLVFVVSDFIGDPGWDRALKLLAHRHEVVTVRLSDPVEMNLPDLGLVYVEDAETGQQMLVDTSDPLLRQRLKKQVEAREAELTDAMRQSGATTHQVTTDEDIVRALVAMVRKSRQRR
jgi:uncharacterized protein (DUF58 family)